MQHSQTMQMRQQRSHRTVCFFNRKLLVVKYLNSSDLVGMTSHRPPFLPLIWPAPHENILKSSQMLQVVWCSKMISTWNDCWLLCVMNEYILCYPLITHPVFHACSSLFCNRHNIKPFINVRKKLGEKFLWAEQMTEMSAQFGTKTTRQNLGWRKLKWGYDKAD